MSYGQKPPHQHHTGGQSNPQQRRRHIPGNMGICGSIACHILRESTCCQYKCKHRYHQCREHIGRAVGHHRPKHRGKLRPLSVGDIARTPHLTETRKYKVDRISAEYTENQRKHGSINAQCAQLHAPTHRPQNMGKHTYGKRQGNPPEIALPVLYRPYHRNRHQ